MTVADALRPARAKSTLLYDSALVIGGSLFVALAAQVTIPLPLSPVPITGQTLAVLLTGAVLGSRRGSLSVLLYLAQGTAGLPVFAGWTGGPARLMGLTGGYLVGFVLGAFVAGLLAERGWDRRPGTAFAAMLLGNAAVYALGLPWLAAFTGPGLALSMGLAPFVIGDLAKLAVATLALPLGWRLIGRIAIG
jgi:biotin transport system substrate-specific component